MAARGRLQALGPGLLMAGAAIGVSHLVQSTRAGAVYGFGLLALVVLANFCKYPAFRWGPAYATATGTSLLEGYRRQGKWALWVYLLVTLGTMFTVQAAVAVVCAGLAKAIFGLPYAATTLAAVLIGICATILAVGRFKWLDTINKVIIVLLSIGTLAATALALPRIDWSSIPFWVAGPITTTDIFFFAAVIGWMPSAIDISVWNSLWTLARRESSGHTPTRDESLFDFNVGYWGCAVLAICFLTLGAAVMYGRGVEFAAGAGGFAAQIIDLYAQVLGEWSRPLIGACAFLVMFSTTLAVVDGFPRALAVLTLRFRRPETPWSGEAAGAEGGEIGGFKGAYWISIVVLAVGAVVVLFNFMTSLKALVDLATTLSFLTAPLLATLNHRAMFDPEVVPAHHLPSPLSRWCSLGAIAFLGAFAAYYLWIRFLGG